MANYSPSEIVDMVGIYYTADNNAREAARRYRGKYLGRRHSDHKAILRLIARARTEQMKRKRSKKQLNNNDIVIITVLGMVIISPYISQRQISRALNVSPATVNRILRANHSSLSLNQALPDNNKVFCVTLCRWAIAQIQFDLTFCFVLCYI